MFLKRLKSFFLLTTVLASFLLFYLWYDDYQFSNNSLEEKYQVLISKKIKKLQYLSYQYFNINRKFPILISNKLESNRYGMTTFDKNQQIKIYLNKKRFKENHKYMIDDVLVHEYAHAIMFEKRDFTDKNSGHTKKWQNICKKLEGLRCDRFVNTRDILIEKTNLF